MKKRKFTRSKELFSEAQKVLPGGVDSPVRAFKAVGGFPPFIERGKGSKIFDADGNTYIDFVCSWGPLILGHSHPQIVSSLKKIIEKGTSFGAPSELETTLGRMICDAIASIERVRFVNSGTEATMSAIRLARANTGRTKVLKFAGCYHGHSDGLLAKAGSGVATLAIPDSEGVPSSYTQNTLIAKYNDTHAVQEIFECNPEEIAAIIVEPIAANMGVVQPEPGFLEGLRGLADEFGALLIFDEVITGFRVDYGGAQAVYEVIPDLTCLGKIIGGGLPIGAYGGRQTIMQKLAPLGGVYQAGTLSGNPVVMTAGIETLHLLKQKNVYKQLEERSSLLEKEIIKAAAKVGVRVHVSRVGSIFTIFFTETLVRDYESAKKINPEIYSRFFHGMLERGIYFPPSQFEAAFISLAHTEADIQETCRTIYAAFQTLSTLENV